MRIERFEDIIAWKKAGQLSFELYEEFKSNRDYGFKDQIQRASVSIMNNISEGFERRTNGEMRYFLFIAKGSSGEVRSMLYLAYKLKYLTENSFRKYYELSIEISKLISGLIKTL